MPARTCSACGAALPPPTSAGRPRTKCEACSPTRKRDIARRAPHKLADVKPIDVNVRAEPTGDPVGIVAVTRATLERAERLHTVAGQAALLLAVQLQDGAHSGAGYAQLAKGLREAMADAMEGVKGANDPLDELQRRRDEKLGLA